MTFSVRTDPAATARREEYLSEYMRERVFEGESFRCATHLSCRRSARTKPGVALFEGQLSHLGSHYDATVNGAPFRVLIVPMDMGYEQAYISLVERRAQVRRLIDGTWSDRNPHMKGVVLALRLAFGLPLGTDSKGEWLDTASGRVHVLDAYAMANLTLCSAIVPRDEIRNSGTSSCTTKIMWHNCLRHLVRTIEILQPTLIIGQGASVRDTLRDRLDTERRVDEFVSIASLAGVRFVWVPLKHPTRNWFSLQSPYLHEVVVPSLSLARQVALETFGGDGDD
jgi:hypothetical protein